MADTRDKAALRRPPEDEVREQPGEAAAQPAPRLSADGQSAANLPTADLPTPDLRELEREYDRLEARAESLHGAYLREREHLQRVQEFLDLSPRAEARLEELTAELFGETLDEIELNLTHAVREVLGQDRTVIANRETKGNRLNVTFSIIGGQDPDHVEDIVAGQGGSVLNILSTGLRLIALSRLDPERHRPFLVLDEQDCWLKPSLVPRFMKLIAEISRSLQLQLLVISHHPLDAFAYAADDVVELVPEKERGVRVKQVHLK